MLLPNFVWNSVPQPKNLWNCRWTPFGITGYLSVKLSEHSGLCGMHCSKVMQCSVAFFSCGPAYADTPGEASGPG